MSTGPNLPPTILEIFNQLRGLLDQNAKQRTVEADKIESIAGNSDLTSDAYRYRREARVYSRLAETITEDINRAGVEMDQVAIEAERIRNGSQERRG